MIRLLRRRLKLLAGVAIVSFCAIIFIKQCNSNQRYTSNTVQEQVVSKSYNSKLELLTETELIVVLQDFDPFENEIYRTANYIATNFTKVTVLIVSEKLPYPPVKIPKLPNVHHITLKSEPGKSLNASRPELNIRTKYVLFLPDGVLIDMTFWRWFQKYANEVDISKDEGIAIPVESTNLKCHGLDFSIQTWTLEIGQSLHSAKCGFITGDHGLLVQTKHLYLLSNPFLPSTFMSIYIQLSLVKIKVVIENDISLTFAVKDPKSYESAWQQKHFKEGRMRKLYSELGIKRVIRETGKEFWFGCNKDSQRCFDTVYNDMPEYLFHGRWTPPCCLRNLRRTTQHVFTILDNCKVRYWLEGGSLLGAARDQDIIPWDYDVDIGIYKEDMIKCNHLLKMSKEGFIDEEGFSWEKAIEGDFYRVQFSESNYLHVDIFPFYSKNGVMTKDTWLKTHRQDTEFPERYLKPLTRIKFAGIEASAPNHVREFLEYKFGKGVIESPKYPDPKFVV